ncbi:hypothetical protein TNCV_2800411 [Trichonephila clavipes]|nr:hypothetical protein TNCV_2800411 [Trichonephila clavipes]
MGINGNEKADFLARTAVEEEVSPTGTLTFSELSSVKKIELHHFGRTPPSHPWYFGRNSGSSFKLMPRKYQTTLSRFEMDVNEHREIPTAIETHDIGSESVRPVKK